jgi:predicted nucleic acid-binding Zn ribbon protein
VTLFPLPRACVICGSDGTATTKRLNGLPVGVVACDECRAAVHRREVGVVVTAKGFYVTDGRPGRTTAEKGAA